VEEAEVIEILTVVVGAAIRLRDAATATAETKSFFISILF
jgi:hypothetical protein